MFSYIRGTLTKATPLYIIVETGGIGYKLLVPASLHTHLPKLNEPFLFHTSLIIRENSQTLYGFIKELERDCFEQLLAVSGIGPKIALSILGHMTPDLICESILNNNISILCKIPGIGRKSAERMIMELKDKLEAFTSTRMQKICIDLKESNHHQLIKDAMSALINLGYNQSTAEKALKKTLAHSPETCDLAHLITSSLQHV